MIVDNRIDMVIDDKLQAQIEESYNISPEYFTGKVKRGLRNGDGSGVVAGVTKIGRVIGYTIEDDEIMPAEGKLFYRGINIKDIVSHHVKNKTFGYEEVAFLLLMGKLPTQKELEDFDLTLSKARLLPLGFNADLIIKSPSRDVMNKLARSVLALHSYDQKPDDTSLENMIRQSIELIARFPTIVANSYSVKNYYFDRNSLHIHIPSEELSVSENFLHMLRQDKSYTPEEAHLLDIMMILHAEHGGGNNSAFVCRALSSSGTDTFSAIAGAVSSLKGPLHGGANARVNQMIDSMKQEMKDTSNEAELRNYFSDLVDGKVGDHSGKIYGLGHAVYTASDPRASIIKVYAKEMAEAKGMLEEYELLEAIENIGAEIITERKKLKTKVCANVDLYSGLVLKMLGIPDELFTPLFAISRVSGWCAHRIEEVMTGKRIMRPAYKTGTEHIEYLDISDR